MQENEAKPHNYKTDIEELKDAGANQVRNELVASNEESNKSLTDAISANTSAVVNLTKSIKGEQKKEDDSAENIVDNLADGSEVKNRVVEQTYKIVKEGGNGFNPFSSASLFSSWKDGSSSKGSRKNAEILVDEYHKHPKTKEEKEYKGAIRSILSGIWGSVRGVVKGIGYLSTFVANSIFHPIETAKWFASKLAPLLAKLAPVAATAIGLGAVIGLGTEVLTTRSQRERFLKSRGAELSDNGSWDVSKMSEYNAEIARGLLDKEGKLKGADEISWGTTFSLAFANFADSFKSGLSELFPNLLNLITDKIPEWGVKLGGAIADCFSSAIKPMLHEFGDSIVDGIAEVTPGMESKAERRARINSELLASSMKDADYDKSLTPWWFFGQDFETYMFKDSMVARHGSKAGTEQGFSEKFLDTFVKTAFEMSALEKRLPQDLWGYVSRDKFDENGKRLSAFELFKTTDEFKRWKETALVADKNNLGEVNITADERGELSELFIKFLEERKKEKSLVHFEVIADKKEPDVITEKAKQAKSESHTTQQGNQAPQNNNTTNNNVVNQTNISYSADPIFDAAWRAALQ